MKDVLKDYWDLRNKAHGHGDNITKFFHIQPHEIPANVFAMAFNDITMALELIDHYYNIWGAPTTKISTSVEETKKQNAERVIAIQKMVFIGIMSSLEFCAKQIIKQSFHNLGRFKGRIYLKQIMEKSKDHSVISDSDFRLWEGVINFRNTLVHNNGIGEIDAVYTYPKCELKMSDGKMTQGNLRLFPSLTDWVLDSIKHWLSASKSP